MFDKTERTLMKMLVKHGTATEITGVFKDKRDQFRWQVRIHRPNAFHDDVYYTGTVEGLCDTITGDTLDDVLDQLDAWVNEQIAILSEVRERRLA